MLVDILQRRKTTTKMREISFYSAIYAIKKKKER
jgi:hypothetical protein